MTLLKDSVDNEYIFIIAKNTLVFQKIDFVDDKICFIQYKLSNYKHIYETCPNPKE